MDFSFPRKKAQVPSSIATQILLSERIEMSNAIKELRHESCTVLGTVVKGAEELDGESCSVCDFCSCSQPCWIPRCQKHRIEPELNFKRAERFDIVQTPSTGSED